MARDSSELTTYLKQYVREIDGIPTVEMPILETAAQELGFSRHDIEVIALQAGLMPLRYLRNYGTVGLNGQLRLMKANVAVIGLGGLGGYIVEGLARLGIGRLILVDGDDFCEHNLNRQLLSNECNMGQPKALAAARRVQSINSSVTPLPYPEYATKGNLNSILDGIDVVVDALDRLPTRMMLQEVAQQMGIPMIHGAIAGWMGQVMTILPDDPGLHALFGQDPVPEQGAEVELGCPPATPMMIAALQIQETVKVILGQEDVLSGKMMIIDGATSQVYTLELG